MIDGLSSQEVAESVKYSYQHVRNVYGKGKKTLYGILERGVITCQKAPAPSVKKSSAC